MTGLNLAAGFIIGLFPLKSLHLGFRQEYPFFVFSGLVKPVFQIWLFTIGIKKGLNATFRKGFLVALKGKCHVKSKLLQIIYLQAH